MLRLVRLTFSAMVTPVTVAVLPATLASGPRTKRMLSKVSNRPLHSGCVGAADALRVCSNLSANLITRVIIG